MLLPTLLLSLLLCCQHFYALLGIWMKLILLILNIVNLYSNVMIHEENTSMDPTQIFGTLRLRIYITIPHSWRYSHMHGEIWSTNMLLLLISWCFCIVATTTVIKCLISPYPEVLTSIGMLPLKLDSIWVSISPWEIPLPLNLPISMIITPFCVTKHWLINMPTSSLLSPLRSLH